MAEREIKFRGFDAMGRKGWVYGDLVHNQKVTETGLEPRVMVGGYEVRKETVGQYTGMVDCVGRDVYEGDIIRLHIDGYEYKGAVEYNGYYGCFELHNGNKRSGLFLVTPANIEIIGNIFDNQDLLNKR